MISSFTSVFQGEGTLLEWMTVVATVVQTTLFTYAVLAGTFYFLRRVLFNYRMVLIALAGAMMFAPVFQHQYLTEMAELLWRSLDLAVASNAVRPEALSGPLARAFSVTHVFCIFLGVVCCHYVKTAIRPSQYILSKCGSSVPPSATFTRWGTLFHSWFLLGLFTWFTFFYHNALNLDIVSSALTPAAVDVLRVASIQTMATSHALAFFIGYHSHDIHFNRGLHKVSERVAFNYYVIRFGLVAVIPTVASVVPGLSFESEHLLRMILLWTIVSFSTARGITLQGMLSGAIILASFAAVLQPAFSAYILSSTSSFAVNELTQSAYKTASTVPPEFAIISLLVIIVALMIVVQSLNLRVRALEDEKAKAPTLAQIAMEQGRQENRKKTAPPCPIGWYTVAFSDELRAGEVFPFHCAGQDLAVFRDEEGEAHVTDAYCPHLGANVAYGKVKGKCVECPFHLWKFDGKTGECSDIFYTNKSIPKAAKLFAWPTMEWAGRVVFFYHPDRLTEPIFSPPKDTELFEGCEEEKGICRSFNSHMFEIMENCSDPVHFEVLHNQPAFPLIKRWSRVTHNITCVDHDFELEFYNKPKVSLFGLTLPDHADVHVSYYGLSMMNFRFIIHGLGTAHLVKTFTQINPTVVQEYDVWYFDPRYPFFLRKFLKRAARVAFEEDFVAWNNKVFLKAPMVVNGDGDIMRRRRWMKQFFKNMDW